MDFHSQSSRARYCAAETIVRHPSRRRRDTAPRFSFGTLFIFFFFYFGPFDNNISFRELGPTAPQSNARFLPRCQCCALKDFLLGGWGAGVGGSKPYRSIFVPEAKSKRPFFFFPVLTALEFSSINTLCLISLIFRPDRIPYDKRTKSTRSMGWWGRVEPGDHSLREHVHARSYLYTRLYVFTRVYAPVLFCTDPIRRLAETSSTPPHTHKNGFESTRLSRPVIFHGFFKPCVFSGDGEYTPVV